MTSQWKTVSFADVVKLEQGLCFNSKTNHLMVEKGIPLLRITDLINNTKTKFVDAERVPKKYIARPQDIIYSRTGQVGLVFKGRVGIVHNNCFRIIPNDGIEPDYVYWYLKQPSVINQARSRALGAAQPDLSHTAFKSILFSYPNVQTQRRIVHILSLYDALIETNARRIQVLEEMARRIYEEWFVRLRFPGHENVRMVERELGLTPDGWRAKRLGDIAQEIRNAVDPSEVEPSTPYVGLEHIPRRSIALIDWGEAKDVQSTKHIFKAGNILFGKIRPYFHKVSVAPLDGVCSSDAIVIEATSDELFPFVLGTVSSDDFVQHAVQTSNGVKMPRANWGVLVNYPVCIPTKSLRTKYSAFIEPALAQIKNLTFKVRNLRLTRDLLLPKLISGDIDVSNFPEPVTD